MRIRSGDTVNNQWRIRERIAKRKGLKVFRGRRINSNEEQVAVKVEKNRYGDLRDSLVRENRFYRHLRQNSSPLDLHGIPEVKEFLATPREHVLVMDYLGTKLIEIFSHEGRRLSLRSVSMIAVQALLRLEVIHKKGIVHRNLNLSNFMVGRGTQRDTLFVVDFKNAGVFRDHVTNALLPDGDVQRFIGTPMFASINAHRRRRQGPRDDLQSLGFLLVYLFTGNLPWARFRIQWSLHTIRRIWAAKRELDFVELCDGLPRPFLRYFRYVNGLQFGQEPAYARMRIMFRKMLDDLNCERDSRFDWNSSNRGRRSLR